MQLQTAKHNSPFISLLKNYEFHLERNACSKHSFLPVLCFYASLPRTSLLQGNTHPGLNGQDSFSFLRLQGAQTSVPKPHWNEHPDLSTVFCFFIVCLLGSQVSIGI
jgi:hypothetical protein